MDIAEVFKRFPAEQDCISYLEATRWPGGPRCPYCGSDRSTPATKELRHHCNNCNTTYSVTVGTIFHQTRVPLQKWLLAVSLLLSARKGISARQLARDLDVHRNTAWRMAMKIREAMRERRQRELLTRIVEMDETYIGPRRARRESPNGPPHPSGRGTDKTPLVGMAERGGRLAAKVTKRRELKARNRMALVRERVDAANAVLMTDEYTGYMTMSAPLPHKSVNHQVWYVEGDVHTNTIDSFRGLLKRALFGTFHKVSVRHLPQFLDEFCFSLNQRRNGDLFGVTVKAARGAV